MIYLGIRGGLDPAQLISEGIADNKDRIPMIIESIKEGAESLEQIKYYQGKMDEIITSE